MKQKIHFIGGGTFSHVRSHLALATPAFGTTVRYLYKDWSSINNSIEPVLHLTKMASPSHQTDDIDLITNQDVEWLVDMLITNSSTKCIVFNAALCDYTGQIGDVLSSKLARRLHSRLESPSIQLSPANKIINKIRKNRKDIFLVAFKTTSGATEQEQYVAGLNLLKENSCNLVFANDIKTRLNMIIVPEEAKYSVTTDRNRALRDLNMIINLRSTLTYTRSEVVDGPSIDWNDPTIPGSLRTVVNYCIEKGAYKPFRGNTAGHFAFKVDNETFYTSKRSTNFNKLDKIGLVKIVAKDRDSVIAYGAKPSVGGMSQRIIFEDHPQMDCIVHFHCPVKPGGNVYHADQYPYECGSHECGENTSINLLSHHDFGLKAVMLHNHGPNIVFNQDIDPNKVIEFIDKNFDLSDKTGGFV